MAIKTMVQLKADLSSMFTTGGVNTASEFRSWSQDVLDSLGQCLLPKEVFLSPPGTLLGTGDHTITHRMDVQVYSVYVKEGAGEDGKIHFPNFTPVDNDGFILHWVGSGLIEFNIYVLVKFGDIR